MKMATNYALRIIVCLANSSGPVPSSEIGKDMGVSAEFVQNIMRTMKKKKLVDSRRGVVGGYVLAKRPENIKVIDVLDALDDEVKLNRGAVNGDERSKDGKPVSGGAFNIEKYYDIMQKMMDKAFNISIKELAYGDFRIFEEICA